MYTQSGNFCFCDYWFCTCTKTPAIVGAAWMIQIMIRSSLSDNFTIFQSTTTWHHRVSIQVLLYPPGLSRLRINWFRYNFVVPIETARQSPALKGLSHGMREFFSIQLKTNFCSLTWVVNATSTPTPVMTVYRKWMYTLVEPIYPLKHVYTHQCTWTK